MYLPPLFSITFRDLVGLGNWYLTIGALLGKYGFLKLKTPEKKIKNSWDTPHFNQR